MRAACQNSPLIKGLLIKMPEYAEVDRFDIPKKYQIDGCYVHSMNTLMEFAETRTAFGALQKLREFRLCLGRDLDEYYQG